MVNCGTNVLKFTLKKKPGMANITGSFNCTMDAKGRIMLPAALLKQIPDEFAGELVIKYGFEKCLVAYTKDEWAKSTEQLNRDLNPYNPEHRKLMRGLMNGVHSIEVDKTRRVLIPKLHQDYAGLKNEILIQGYSSYIEIWDKATYEKEYTNDQASISALANKVLGEKKN